MFFWILLIFLIMLIPVGIVFIILFFVEQQKTKRMRRYLHELVNSGRISSDEYYFAISGKTTAQQAYPQPQSVQQPQPPMYPQAVVGVSSPNGVRQGNKVSSANFILVIGVLLVILSGVIFATTAWEQLISPIKVSLLLLTSGLFFGASVLAHKKFGLRQTGVAFYSLGSVFIPVSILAIGFLELFGSWLSVYGRGGWLLGAIAALLLGVAFFLGHRVYKKPVLYWMLFFSICATISSVMLFISGTTHMLTFSVAIFSIALMLLSRFGKGFATLKPQAEVFFWITTGLGFISSARVFVEDGHIGFLHMLVVALLLLMHIFKAVVEKSLGAKHLSAAFALLLLTQCFSSMSRITDKTVFLYYSVAVTATCILFEFIRDKSNSPLLRSLTSDILFSAAIFFSAIIWGNSKIESSLIWLCLFLLLSLLGEKRRVMRFLRPIPLFFFGVMATTHFIGSAYPWHVFVGALLLFIFGALPFLSGKGQTASDSCLSFCIFGGISVAILELYFIIELWAPRNIPLLISTMALLVGGAIVAYRRKNVLPIIFPMLFAVPFLGISLGSLCESSVAFSPEMLQGIFGVLLFVLLMTAGRLIHESLYTTNMPDVFTISAFIAPIYIFFIGEGWWNIVGWLLLCVYGFSFVGRACKSSVQKLAALLGSVALCMAIYTQSVFDWNNVIKLKVFLILPFLVLLLCRLYIYPSSRKTLGGITFYYSIFTSVVLFGEGFIHARIFDALLLLMLAIGIVVMSFMKKTKKWLLLSSITLIAVAVYLSRDFWSSLAWWAYLLICGAILITIAIMSEVNRHQEKSMKKNVLGFFEDWDW